MFIIICLQPDFYVLSVITSLQSSGYTVFALIADNGWWDSVSRRISCNNLNNSSSSSSKQNNNGSKYDYPQEALCHPVPFASSSFEGNMISRWNSFS